LLGVATTNPGVIVLELMVEEVLETGEKEGAKPAEVLASFPDEVLLQQVAEEALGQVFGVIMLMSPPPREGV